MRRADAIWYYNTTTLTDVTRSLGDGSVPITLGAGQALYVGHRDWLSGLLTFISTVPNATPTITIETWDGINNTWETLPMYETIDQIALGKTFHSSAYNFTYSGVAQWNHSPWLWTLKRSINNWPIASVSPPADVSYFWVRVTNSGSISVTIDRLLPVLYNTYATHEDITAFLGIDGATDSLPPMQSWIREKIKDNEDRLNEYCRRTWKPTQVINERVNFNPYGVATHVRPVWFVTRLGVWSGSQFQPLIEGRINDFYVSPEKSFINFTRVALGRGLPVSSIASRYLRLADAMEYDYVAGEDFDQSSRRGTVREIITKRVAAELAVQSDWTNILINNPDVFSKIDKVNIWKEEALMMADELRMPLIA